MHLSNGAIAPLSRFPRGATLPLSNRDDAPPRPEPALDSKCLQQSG